MSRSINGRYTLAYPNLLGFQELTSDSITDKSTGHTVFYDITDLETHSSLGNDLILGTSNTNTITVNSGSTTYNNNQNIILKDNSSSSYILGSAGNTSMMVLDTTNATPNVNLSSSTNLIINNANDSSSYTDGTAALVVKGGISCSKRIVGGNISANGNLYASWDTTVVHALNVGNVINSTYTAPSTSTTTGGLICAGGVGVAGDMNVGGTVTTTHLISTGSVQGVGIASTGNIQAYSNTIYGGSIIASGAISGTTITGTGALSVGANSITCGTLSPQNILLPTSGGTATALNYYESNVNFPMMFQGAGGGGTTTTVNLTISRIGNIVNIIMPIVNINSNGSYITTNSAYYLPTRFRPSAVYIDYCMHSMNIATYIETGMINVCNTGAINICKSSSVVGFGVGTGSGTANIFHMVYSV